MCLRHVTYTDSDIYLTDYMNEASIPLEKTRMSVLENVQWKWSEEFEYGPETTEYFLLSEQHLLDEQAYAENKLKVHWFGTRIKKQFHAQITPQQMPTNNINESETKLMSQLFLKHELYRIPPAPYYGHRQYFVKWPTFI